MRKTFLISTAFVGLAAGSAMAADMPIQAPPIVAVPACAQFGGFYLGGNVGWKYYKHDWKDKDNFGFGVIGLDHVGDGTESDNGWTAGIQAGYNLQFHCTVWGIQADWNWTNAETDTFWTDFPTANQQTFSYKSDEKWFGTVRTRAGVVVDNLLLYVTGGLAFAKFDRDFLYTTPFFAGTQAQAFSNSDTRLGFVVGVGTEWALSPNWSINSEILYMGFERDEQAFTCTNANLCPVAANIGAFRYDFDDSQWVARIGVNYRFGGYAPIVARY